MRFDWEPNQQPFGSKSCVQSYWATPARTLLDSWLSIPCASPKSEILKSRGTWQMAMHKKSMNEYTVSHGPDLWERQDKNGRATAIFWVASLQTLQHLVCRWHNSSQKCSDLLVTQRPDTLTQFPSRAHVFSFPPTRALDELGLWVKQDCGISSRFTAYWLHQIINSKLLSVPEWNEKAGSS